jgi:hypothetical protein
VPVVAAMCSGPLSPPMYSAARHERPQLRQGRTLRTARSRLRGGGLPAPGVGGDASAASRSDGPDVMIMRRGPVIARQRGRHLGESAAAGQRRNGLPALTCSTTSGACGAPPRLAQAALDATAGRGIGGISTGVRHAAGGGCRAAQQVPLVQTEWRGGTSARVHGTSSCRPSAVRQRVADARGAPVARVSHALRGPP